MGMIMEAALEHTPTFVDALLPFETPDDPALRHLLSSLQVPVRAPALTLLSHVARLPPRPLPWPW